MTVPPPLSNDFLDVEKKEEERNKKKKNGTYLIEIKY
jgi:hypothetical protein